MSSTVSEMSALVEKLKGVKIRRIQTLLLTLLGAAFVTIVLFSAVASARAQNQKPNVVFILADNVGYGDLGPYGGGELRGYPTPRSTSLPAKVCASRNFSSSPPAPRRAPRS